MNKILLLTLICLPMIGFGQDIPLIEKKVTTEKMENQDRRVIGKKVTTEKKMENQDRRVIDKNKRKIYRAGKLDPMMQIGYISNPLKAPFGLNFFTFPNKIFGLYVDLRTDFNVYAPYWLDIEDDMDHINTMGGIATGELEEGGYNILNFGIALSLFRTEKNATSIYFGYGVSKVDYYQEYGYNWLGIGYEYWFKESSLESENYNIGLLFQYNSVISWQIGYDSAVPGINVGIGFNFKNR
ncbi:hypothetical protein N8301_00890 [Cyclobacteriaceae bacterium]|nr:hypothetical protein [Cyclobacteriaceae bacterium]